MPNLTSIQTLHVDFKENTFMNDRQTDRQTDRRRISNRFLIIKIYGNNQICTTRDVTTLHRSHFVYCSVYFHLKVFQ